MLFSLFLFNLNSFLVQVKSNQKKPLEDCEHIGQHLPCKETFATIDKAHGRLEQRQAKLYELNLACLEPRWHKTQLATLVVMDRQRLSLKDGILSPIRFWVDKQV